MSSFARVVRLALRHYWTVAASFLCALVVAVLWGGNIGFIYPIVEVVGMKQSLSDWADASIADANRRIAEQAAAEKRLAAELAGAAPDAKPGLERALRTARARREAATRDLRLT
jgi:ATP-binding cassette subfamily B protein/subfamily B ATP-binding cassette protein MsbA